MPGKGEEIRSHNQRHSLTPYDGRIVQAIAVVAAVGALTASGALTGVGPVDALYRATAAGIITIAGGRARRWTLLLLGAVATVVGHDWISVLGVASLLIAFGAAARAIRLRLLGALAAALAVQVLLRQQPYGFQGASALVGAMAVAPVLVSAHRRCRAEIRHRTVVAVGLVLGLGVALTLLFGAAALLASRQLKDGANEAQAALEAARRGDTATAQVRLRSAEASFDAANRFTAAAWARPARLVPLVSQHAEALLVATEQGRSVAEAGGSVARVGDYRNLKYRSGRIDLKRVDALAMPLRRAFVVLDAARRRLHDLDRSWLLGPVANRLNHLIGEIDHATDDARIATEVVTEAPDLLGGHGTRTYFVAFVNPAEERGGGGFLGNYGVLTAQNGKLRLTRSGPIKQLIDARKPGQRVLNGPPDYLARYGRFAPADFFQDVTFSPQFPYTADVIEQLYPQSGGGRIDGVISIDPYGLAALLQLTGPIRVAGLDRPLTAANAAETLLKRQYLTFGDADNSLRKDLLVQASRITFDKLTSGDLPSPERLVELLGPIVRQRRLMLSATRSSEEHLFHDIGANGALPKATGDFLMVAHQNFGNNKIDAYLHRTIRYEATVDPTTGRINATADVTMKNDAPPRGLPRIVIGNNRKFPNGTNLQFLTVYSPLQLDRASLDGKPLSMTSGREAGLSTYTAEVAIKPGGTGRLSLRFGGNVDLSSGRYTLTVVPQSMVNPDVTSVGFRTSGSRPPVRTVARREPTEEPRHVSVILGH